MDPRSLALSYKKMLNILGWLGIALPVLLLSLGALANRCPSCTDPCKMPFDSISGYYYSNVSSIFIAIICAFAVFMFAYPGQDQNDKKPAFLSENVVTNLAAVGLILLVLFPTPIDEVAPECCRFNQSSIWGENKYLHFFGASLFFIVCGYLSLFQFTKSGATKTKEKNVRNRIYRICGVSIGISILLVPITNYFEAQWHLPEWHTFALETVMLWSFGVSFITKGETWLTDKPA